MTEPQIPDTKSTTPKPSPPQIPTATHGGGEYSHKPHFPNPPESLNPDAATLRDQWRFAIKQYSRWYSHAWGTAILAGVSFFALGWVIKGSNPLPSFDSDRKNSGGGGGDEHKPAAPPP